MRSVTWQFLFLFGAVALAWSSIGLGMMVALNMAPRSDKVATHPDCTADPNLRIKVGANILSVPRRYSPSIFDTAGKSSGNAKRVCQRPNDPAIYAGLLSFNFDGNTHNTSAEDSLTQPIWHVHIQLVRSNLLTTSERAYERNVNLIEDLGSGLTDLETRHGFLVFDGYAHDGRIYFSLPDSTVPPRQDLLVVNCSRSIPPHSELQSQYGRSCRTSHHQIADPIVGRYQYYDGRTSLAEFSDLQASVRRFVESLIVGDN